MPRSAFSAAAHGEVDDLRDEATFLSQQWSDMTYTLHWLDIENLNITVASAHVLKLGVRKIRDIMRNSRSADYVIDCETEHDL